LDEPIAVLDKIVQQCVAGLPERLLVVGAQHAGRDADRDNQAAARQVLDDPVAR
jgi:hypothetical protein